MDGGVNPIGRSASREQVLHDMSVDVREAETAALENVVEPGMIDA